MSKKILIIITVLVLAAATVIPAAAITWGEPDTVHTNVGALVVTWPDDSMAPGCSGTLIHPRVFLTAGHCTEALGPEYEPYGVTFVNDAYNPDPAEVYPVVAVTHPDYWWGPSSNPHDVGVLILEQPVTDITPATLPEEGFLDDLKKAGILQGHGERTTGHLITQDSRAILTRLGLL